MQPKARLAPCTSVELLALVLPHFGVVLAPRLACWIVLARGANLACCELALVIPICGVR